MKTIIDLKIKESAVVKKIIAKGELRERLISFGIAKNSAITLKNCNTNCENIEIEVDNVLIALRKVEAKQIEIQ
jgi:ferrous iron transport protein A